VAYKVITGMRTPDHSTIAEFRRRHEVEIAELFDDVLGLCREAGLVSVGVIAIDGTKVKANASMDANRSYRQVVSEILREADETDRREDELYGDARGDELPEQLRTAEGRKQALAEAKRRLAERKGRAAQVEHNHDEGAEIELDRQRFMTAPPPPGRSHAVATTGFWTPPSGWKRTCGSRSPPTGPTTLGDAKGLLGTATRAAHRAGRLTRGSRRCCRTVGSTPLIRTRG
jgi:hypothetical protein